MLDPTKFQAFIGQANKTHQQFCLWFSTNNEFAKHQSRWNEFVIASEKFPEVHGCKYKNFWSVVVATLQHGWILGLSRLFDPAYHSLDKNKKRPRISLDYVLTELDNKLLSNKIQDELKSHQPVLNSLKELRKNWLAHNDANFNPARIEAGVENLFQWLEEKISEIKNAKQQLSGLGVINIGYNEKLAQCGVDEIFATLLIGEGRETK